MCNDEADIIMWTQTCNTCHTVLMFCFKGSIRTGQVFSGQKVPWLTSTGPSSLELNHWCLKLVFTVKVIMFCQLIPFRPTCPTIIIIICLNEITQWLSSFHWSHKAAWFGNISRRGRAGTYSRWGTMWCRVGIILLGPNDLMLTLDGSGSQWRGFNPCGRRDPNVKIAIWHKSKSSSVFQ